MKNCHKLKSKVINNVLLVGSDLNNTASYD